ncbi:MAG: hypothetical protein R2851_07605 [Caldilineaceae bacterium]
MNWKQTRPVGGRLLGRHLARSIGAFCLVLVLEARVRRPSRNS